MNKLLFAMKVLVTGGLLWAVFVNVEPSNLRAALVRADALPLLAATALYAMTFVVGGIRWRAIAAAFGYGITVGFSVRCFFISGFFSQFVVGGGYGGDVYRIWVLAKKTKSKLKSFVTVFVDRASGLVSAMLAVACMAPVYGLAFPAHAVPLLWISLACGLGILVLVSLAWMGRRGRSKIVHGKGKTGWSRMREASRDLADGFLRWPSTAVHLAWSFVALALNILAMAVVGDAIGLDLGLASYFFLGPIVFIAKSFPLSVAGWGAREVAMIYFFGFAGVDVESAFAMSLITGVLVLAASLIGGALWLGKSEPAPLKTD